MAQKILVVDDDPYLRDIYEETLRDAGFEIEIAVNGEEGLSKLQAGGYDLCILDIMLPKIDGLGILDAVKKNPPSKPNGPIIVLSNLSHESLIQDALNRGAVSYLIKADLTPAMLLTEIKRHIKPN